MTGDLQPIADAVMNAERAAIERAEYEHRRIEDRKFLRGCLKKNGKRLFLSVARALQFDEDEIEAIIAEADKKKKRAGAPPDAAGTGDDGAGEGGGEPPKPAEGGGGTTWTPARNPVKPLPEDCPVRPLGVRGLNYFYLKPSGAIVELEANKHNAGGLRGLFGNEIEYLWRTWPKFLADGNQNGWKPDGSAESLMTAASRLPPFDPIGSVRGLGGWADDTGGLVLHCGDGILWRGEWLRPGAFGDFIYPAEPPALRPLASDGDAAGLIRQLLGMLDTWNWSGDLDGDGLPLNEPVLGGKHKLASLLVLGWMMAAKAGAALKYRPIIWLTGDAGSGKSTLMDLIEMVLGEKTGIVKSSDPTAAGIWQKLKTSTRAVAVDEAENEANPARVQSIVKLARQSATGGIVLRGSNSHESAEFEAKSAFMFGSIIVPPQLGADISRTSLLQLAQMEGGRSLTLEKKACATMGRALLSRLVDGWGRWHETYGKYQAELAREGHVARGCNQWGTMLAMADLALFDGAADGDTVLELVQMVPRARVDASNHTDANAKSMLQEILSTPLDVFRGGTRMTIDRLVRCAALIERGGKKEESTTPQSAVDALESWGLYVRGAGQAARVILPNQNKGLAKLLEGTSWGTQAGAAGGWSQAMRRLPGAKAENSRAFGGRGVSVPVEIFLREDDDKQGEAWP